MPPQVNAINAESEGSGWPRSSEQSGSEALRLGVGVQTRHLQPMPVPILDRLVLVLAVRARIVDADRQDELVIRGAGDVVGLDDSRRFFRDKIQYACGGVVH